MKILSKTKKVPIELIMEESKMMKSNCSNLIPLKSTFDILNICVMKTAM